jgi:two-component system sensor histidine kinase ChvG
LATDGALKAETQGKGVDRLRWYRSIRVQCVALAAVLVVLPALMFSVLAQADAERRLLVLNSVSETGNVVAAALAPTLRDLRPADTDVLAGELARFSAADRSIRILFRPSGEAGARGFYLLAAAPPIPAEQAEDERQQLLRLGIVSSGNEDCAAQLSPGETPPFLSGGTEIMTSVLPVPGNAGCWAIVIATGEQRVLGAVRQGPYWSRPETRLAIFIYALMALLIVIIFAGVWSGLLRFRRLALSQTAASGFAGSTSVPELGELASAFDEMVARLRRSATMIRQSAEDNAHAFKGPIATIRQVMEPLRRRELPALRDFLQVIETALDRLDGLVQSARVLDSAAAELLDLQQSRVDFSALATALTASMAGTAEAREVRIEAAIEPGIFVNAQADALETIVENLVDNAISFSPSGSVVRVQLGRTDGTIQLAVIDEGPGVAPGQLECIFDRYYSNRAQSPAPQNGETHFGIGLWITRQNVLAIGGNIVPIPESPRGLRMIVTLPPA